jgi:hypothetical protein
MDEATMLIGLLCFIIGFLLRGEIQRFRKKKHESENEEKKK